MKHFYLLAAALMLSAPLANGQVNLHIAQQASSLTSTATHFMVDVSKPTENTFSFALFTDDIWYGGPAIRGWYSEAWLYFPVCSWAQLGGVGCFSWDFAQAPMFGLYLGVKFNLL